MSVEEPMKVDLVFRDKIRKQVVLLITDHLDWEDEGEHLWILQEKFNNYLAFVESGQLVETNAGFGGLPVRIHVAAMYPLSKNATRFYELAAETAAKLDCTIEFDLGGEAFKK